MAPNLGIAFQLIDDALDYGGSSAKLGKNVGDDFREGKITLPGRAFVPARLAGRARILEAHARARRGRRKAISNSRSRTMRRHRAIEDTIERARHYGAMARDSLELFPASPWKHALLGAVDFAVQRAH